MAMPRNVGAEFLDNSYVPDFLGAVFFTNNLSPENRGQFLKKIYAPEI